VFVSSLATFVFPFLALYLAARGVDARKSSLIVSLLGVGAIVAGPLSGGIADRWGRRPVILGALLGSAIASAYLGLVQSLLLIAPGVFVFGLCAMMVFPAVNATVADLVPAEEVQRGYGLLYWAQNTGIAVSSLVGGLLATRSWTLLFWSDAFTTLFFAALVFRRVPESKPAAHAEERGWSHVLRDRSLVFFLVAQILFVLVWWQFQFAAPIAMQRQRLSPSSFGALLGTNCVLLLVLQPLITPKVQKLNPRRLLACAALLVGVGYGLYTFCTSTLQYVLATMVWSSGELLGLPAASALIAQMAPEDLRGRYQGSYGVSFSIGMTLAPLASGAIIERFGFHVLWPACFALGVGVAALHLFLARRRA
jgi:MFS family permease